MRHRFARILFAAFALAALFLSLARAQTTPNPPLYSPVLLGGLWSAATNNVEVPAEFLPTGGAANARQIAFFAHDFSWTRFGSGRYFLRHEGPQVNQQDTALVAYDETGAQRILLNDPAADLVFTTAPRWSLDGTRIAWGGGRYDPTNPSILTESGVYIGDVTLDASGNPASVTNVRRVFAQSAVPSWTGDQQYLILLANRAIYRVPASATASDPGQVINIGNVRSGVWPAAVKASPASGDTRIAYTLQSQRSWYDLWTVVVPANYNPATDVLTATQITKNGPIAPDGSLLFYEHWDWSPDGSTFVLSAGGVVDTIPSTGGKLTTILSARGTGYNVWLWRN